MNRKQIDEIVARIVESGFGARENDWASHQEFAHALLAELAKQAEPVAVVSLQHSLPIMVGTTYVPASDPVKSVTLLKDVDFGAPLFTHPLQQADLVAEVERLKEWKATAEGLLRDGRYPELCSETEQLRQQLSAAQADNEQLAELMEEVEQRYFALLKEKDVEAEGFKAEGDMYGWNFHTGVRSGAVEMHLYMTKLIKAIAAHKARHPVEGPF